jgi:hypothetical protein
MLCPTQYIFPLNAKEDGGGTDLASQPPIYSHRERTERWTSIYTMRDQRALVVGRYTAYDEHTAAHIVDLFFPRNQP